MDGSDGSRMDEVYVALSALSIVGGAITALVGYVGTTVRLSAVAGATDVRLRGWVFVIVGAALVAVGTGYLAARSLSRFRRSRASTPDAGDD